jgi:RHS repeat-associated protein
VALTSAGGTAATTYTFEPFGRTEGSGSPSPNPFRFTGREDEGTGLYYYRARYYDPGRARFISTDSADQRTLTSYDYVDSVGKVIEGNLYTYARNSPTNFIDPSGESALGIAVKVLRNLLGLGVYGWMTGAMGGKPTNEAELKDTDGDGVPDYEDPEPFNPNEPVPGAGGMCPVQPTVPFTPKRYPPVRPY